jgi:putative phosphoribosyl transferase
LAGPRLAAVTAPTLLVVGAWDTVVLGLNQQALKRLCRRAELAVVPGAGDGFDEPGTFDLAADLARDWFAQYLRPGRRHGR